MTAYAESCPDGSWLVRVKAVPGASRDAIAGVLGDRLKVRVSAPPEAGKANTAITALLAARLGVRPADVTLQNGASSPFKLFLVTGCAPSSVHRLGG